MRARSCRTESAQTHAWVLMSRRVLVVHLTLPHKDKGAGTPAPVGLLPATWEDIGEDGGRVHDHFPTFSWPLGRERLLLAQKQSKSKGKQRWKQKMNSQPRT